MGHLLLCALLLLMLLLLLLCCLNHAVMHAVPTPKPSDGIVCMPGTDGATRLTVVRRRARIAHFRWAKVDTWDRLLARIACSLAMFFRCDLGLLPDPIECSEGCTVHRTVRVSKYYLRPIIHCD